jgi:hypothetical protein
MARSVSTVFKFQGTLGEVTFVKSRRYKPHARMKRGTYTPITINETLKESKELLMHCNGNARLIFQPLREEHRDGTLWSRLLSMFFKQAKAGLKPTVNMFAGLECSTEHTLETLLDDKYEVIVTREKKKLSVAVNLQRHPHWESKNMRGYDLSVVVLFPNFPKQTVKKEVAGVDVSLATAPEPLVFDVPMPSANAPYLVLLGIEGYGPGKKGQQPSTRGLKVVGLRG